MQKIHWKYFSLIHILLDNIIIWCFIIFLENIRIWCFIVLLENIRRWCIIIFNVFRNRFWFRIVWNSWIKFSIFWIRFVKIWIRFPMIRIFPPWWVLGLFMIAGAYFFCGVIFSGVNLVDNFNIEELSSLPGDKFSLCWVVLALGLMSNFFFCGAICFDIVLKNLTNFFHFPFIFPTTFLKNLHWTLTLTLTLNFNLNLTLNLT